MIEKEQKISKEERRQYEEAERPQKGDRGGDTGDCDPNLAGINLNEARALDTAVSVASHLNEFTAKRKEEGASYQKQAHVFGPGPDDQNEGTVYLNFQRGEN